MCWIFEWFFLIVHFSNKFTKLNERVPISIGQSMTSFDELNQTMKSHVKKLKSENVSIQTKRHTRVCVFINLSDRRCTIHDERFEYLRRWSVYSMATYRPVR